MLSQRCVLKAKTSLTTSGNMKQFSHTKWSYEHHNQHIPDVVGVCYSQEAIQNLNQNLIHECNFKT